MRLKVAAAVLAVLGGITVGSCSRDDGVNPDVGESSPTLASASMPGPYGVQTLTDSGGLRPPDPVYDEVNQQWSTLYGSATIYYPDTSAPGPLASVVIITGFWADESAIAAWGPFYASHGIVAMTLGAGGRFDSPEQRAAGLLDAIVTLRAENTREASPLKGRLDERRIAVSGWSMGGGAAQLAAMQDASLKAAVSLSPWLYDLHGGQTLPYTLDHAVPMLIVVGTEDESAAPEWHASLYYETTPVATNKLLFIVDGGDHEVANGPSVVIEDAVVPEVGRVALSWLMVYLVEDARYRPLVLEVPQTASQYVTNLEP